MTAPPRPCRVPAIRALAPVSRQNGVQAGIEPALRAALKITLVGSARPGRRVHTCAPSGALPKGRCRDGRFARPLRPPRGATQQRQGDVRIDGARVWTIRTGLAEPTSDPCRWSGRARCPSRRRKSRRSPTGPRPMLHDPGGRVAEGLLGPVHCRTPRRAHRIERPPESSGRHHADELPTPLHDLGRSTSRSAR
jgi:hypothetical protein